MFTSSGLKKLSHLQTVMATLMTEQFPDDISCQTSTQTYPLYQKAMGLLSGLIEKNPARISPDGLSYYTNYFLPLCKLIPSARKLTHEQYTELDEKQKKLLVLFNHHFSKINPIIDLLQNFSKKKSYASLLAERDEGATLYYEFHKQFGAYTQWYVVDLLLDKIELVVIELRPALGQDHQLLAQLQDLRVSIELISYLPTCFVDQTQMATLVTAIETSFNQIVKLNAYPEAKFTGLRKQLHDMSREFEVQETRRHERQKQKRLAQRITTLQQANHFLVDCLLQANFSSTATLDPVTGNRLLEIIAQTGNRELLQKVLAQNPQLEIDYPNAEGCCALGLAILENHQEAAVYLKEKGAQLERIDSQGMTILQKTASGGNKAAVKLALKLGAAIDFLGNTRLSAFELAVIYHHFDIASYLCEQNANMNRVDEAGEPFLHWLVKERNDSDIDFLLKLAGDNGKKPQLLAATDASGCSAWDKAVQECHYMTLRLFKQHGVNIEAVDNKGLALLHRAAASANLDLMVVLLALDCNPNALDAEGNTALHTAFSILDNDQLLKEVASLLLDAGAQGDRKNKVEQTALDILKGRQLSHPSHQETLLAIANVVVRQGKQQKSEAYGKSLNAWRGWSPFFDRSYTDTLKRKQFVNSRQEFQQKASSSMLVFSADLVNLAKAIPNSASSVQPVSVRLARPAQADFFQDDSSWEENEFHPAFQRRFQ